MNELKTVHYARDALIVFKHKNKLGNAPSHKLLEGVTVKRKDGVEVARCYEDYDVVIPEDLKKFCSENGIEIIEKI